jgi:hypothetical protein
MAYRFNRNGFRRLWRGPFDKVGGVNKNKEKEVKKVLCMITAALLLTAAGVRAQGSEELVALQKQLNELSAKIAQLEQDNAAKLAQLQKDSDSKAWSIEQLQAEGKKDEAASWANDIKIKGDFRARYENREVANNTTKDRQRIRLRVGAYGKVNDFTDFGVRLATGGSRTSSNADLGDSGSMKNIYLDQAYIDFHPNQMPGTHTFIGKMPQPWMAAGSGLVWDTDLNPEGVAVTYEKQLVPFKLMANAGTFVMKENDANPDIQLWSGQIAGEKKIGSTTLTVGISDYYFQNANSSTNLTNTSGSRNTPRTDFNLVEGFGSYAFTVFKMPVLLNGQYVVNVDAANSDEDTAYLAGITVGKAKDKGTWEVGYNWRDIDKDAVVAGLNDSDFAGETWTDCYGHVLRGKYQIAKNLSLDGAYILSTDYQNRAANTFQADLNFKF